jgi:hypothetical protein
MCSQSLGLQKIESSRLSIINNNPLKWEGEMSCPSIDNKELSGNMKSKSNHHCHHELEHEQQASAITIIMLWNMKSKQADHCALEHEEEEFGLEFPLNLSTIIIIIIIIMGSGLEF